MSTFRLRAPRDRARGQSLVEFSLVFPIIVLVIVGFFEIGRAVFAYNMIASAARQGVRVATVNQLSDVTDCDATRPVEDPYEPHWSIRGCAIAAGTVIGLKTANIAVSYAAPPGTTLACSSTLHVGCIATVTVSYNFTIATPFISKLIGPFTMSQSSSMPIERVFP
ncbi:MAG TPA: TadE/TadG family type IV pilus assembly protein [Candidatus Limnocylindrales bacterium]|nr:TadE/TadG family type IV pilus assembly protein [Candidatus Limnocylindrales bacterium]